MMSSDAGKARCRWCVLLTMLMLVLACVLAACGTNSITGSPGGQGTASPIPSPTQGQASLHGCPGAAVVATRPTPAGVVLTTKNSGSTVNVTRGETIEVDLPFGHVWSGPANLSPGLLTMQTPAGYEASAIGACVWRFTAIGPGSVRLSFVGRPVCEKGQVCPLYVMAVIFTLTIS